MHKPCTKTYRRPRPESSGRDGSPVKTGDRIADIDPRGKTDDIDHISDKSKRVAEGVLEALLGLISAMEAEKGA